MPPNEVRITVTADDQDAQRTFKDVRQSADALAGQLRTVGLALGVAGGAVAGLGFAGIQAASSLRESVSAINRVFGEASDVIHEFGEVSVETVGLTTTEFNKLSLVTGSMLQNVGFSAREAADETIRLTQVAADLAADFERDVPSALEAVNAALRGEIDPIEKLGITITEQLVNQKALALGLADTTSEIGIQEKQAARLALIYEQSSKSLGAFADQSSDVAIRQQQLTGHFKESLAALGEGLLPAYNDALGALIPLVSQLSKLTEEHKGLTSAILLGGGAIGGLGVSLTGIGLVLPPTITGFRLLKTAALGLAGVRWATISTGIASIGTASLLAAGRIAAVVGAIVAAPAAFRTLAEVLDPGGGGVRPETREVLRENPSAVFQAFKTELQGDIGDMIDSINIFSDEIESLNDKVQDELGAGGGAGGAGGAGGGRTLSGAFSGASVEIGTFSNRAAAMADVLGAAIPEITSTRSAVFDMSTAAGRAAFVIAGLGRDAKETAKALDPNLTIAFDHARLEAEALEMAVDADVDALKNRLLAGLSDAQSSLLDTELASIRYREETNELRDAIQVLADVGMTSYIERLAAGTLTLEQFLAEAEFVTEAQKAMAAATNEATEALSEQERQLRNVLTADAPLPQPFAGFFGGRLLPPGGPSRPASTISAAEIASRAAASGIDPSSVVNVNVQVGGEDVAAVVDRQTGQAAVDESGG